MSTSAQVNGVERDVAGSRLTELVHSLAGRSGGVAVAVNGEVVPRSAWDATAVAADDIVEVVTAVQGG
ncbi:sulfur carrier protein ThiS [Angustibacter sp. McL0619]|uniref:sulfur carrier protein ThiS n=1 Tax=Angustibacter sp. McL0619 TaxID=3415676 RepID=UPI003CEBFBBF